MVIMEKKSDDILFVDTWLMSCRVLKRGMEEYVINHMIQAAKENGFAKITAEYIATPKNSMVKDIYSQMGFEKNKENMYEVIVDTFKPLKTYIQEEG